MFEASTLARHIETKSGTALQQTNLYTEDGAVAIRSQDCDAICVDVKVIANSSEIVGRDRQTHPSPSSQKPTALPEAVSTEMVSSLCTGIATSLDIPTGWVKRAVEDPSDPFLRCEWVETPQNMHEEHGTVVGYFTSSIPDVSSAKTTIHASDSCCPNCDDDVNVYGALRTLCWACPHCPCSGMGFSTTAEMADAIGG